MKLSLLEIAIAVSQHTVFKREGQGRICWAFDGGSLELGLQREERGPLILVFSIAGVLLGYLARGESIIAHGWILPGFFSRDK